MKKIFAGLFLVLSSFAAQSQTVDEIISKYEAAAGGREKLEGVKQLEVISNVRIGMMGQNIDLPLTLVREKGKLFRRQVSGIMGMGDSFTMITDTSGNLYIPGMRNFGGPGGGGFGGGGGRDGRGGGGENGAQLTRMTPEEVAAQQYELDCAGAFPELVNYAAKGHKAELAGTEKISKVPCYKIKMTLKTGQVVTYYIDTNTFLVKQMETSGDMAANLTGFRSLMQAFGSNVPKNTKATVLVKEYGDFKEIKFPRKLVLSYGPIESEVENTNIQINEGLEEKWYHPKP
ncbi:hypothetical protein GWC95_17475 [Sediminibacterium roseum]|uniref:DUF4412 domain-containing protein n=1 Tax=Sediminibacterium roseum TaxID=1978412 RepID=A0ABW9ZX37_9BACT|nr:hypothetical protein [Sediminibacterium roseum]NCI51719.1 hypothetical protein [Sediminibacterium roseum]